VIVRSRLIEHEKSKKGHELDRQLYSKIQAFFLPKQSAKGKLNTLSDLYNAFPALKKSFYQVSVTQDIFKQRYIDFDHAVKNLRDFREKSSAILSSGFIERLNPDQVRRLRDFTKFCIDDLRAMRSFFNAKNFDQQFRNDAIVSIKGTEGILIRFSDDNEGFYKDKHRHLPLAEASKIKKNELEAEVDSFWKLLNEASDQKLDLLNYREPSKIDRSQETRFAAQRLSQTSEKYHLSSDSNSSPDLKKLEKFIKNLIKSQSFKQKNLKGKIRTLRKILFTVLPKFPEDPNNFYRQYAQSIFHTAINVVKKSYQCAEDLKIQLAENERIAKFRREIESHLAMAA
jgi:hypothetical protein